MYSAPNHTLINGDVNLKMHIVVNDATKTLNANNSLNTFIIFLLYPSATRLPIAAPVLFSVADIRPSTFCVSSV